MKAENLLNIHQVLNVIGKCVSLQFAEACDHNCEKCVLAKNANQAGSAIDELVDILNSMKNGKPISETKLKVTMSKAWGMQMEVAEQVAREAIEALGLSDRHIVQINVRADWVVKGVIAEITERVDDTVRNYSYLSKKVKWRFDDDYTHRRTI